MSQITSVVLAERPKTSIIPGQTFRVEIRPAPTEADLQDGQLLVETLYAGLDPAMRGWLNETRSYIKPVQIGDVMRCMTVARVLATRAPEKAQVGDVILVLSGWAEIAIVESKGIINYQHLMNALPEPMRSRVHMTDMLGFLGPTGLTAYYGMTKVAGTIKPTDTVVVSAAAGATGSIVAQIAKMQGAKRVVGIAGSDAKCQWLVDSLGLDAAINYKDPDFAKKFSEATPEFIDVYWDNVGGDILDLALERAAVHARFVMCGGISQYNTGKQIQGPKNYLHIIMQRIRMEGFIVLDYSEENEKAVKELCQWLIEGKIKSEETIIKGGLKIADEALLQLFNGTNMGKLILEVKNPFDDISKL